MLDWWEDANLGIEKIQGIFLHRNIWAILHIVHEHARIIWPMIRWYRYLYISIDVIYKINMHNNRRQCSYLPRQVSFLDQPLHVDFASNFCCGLRHHCYSWTLSFSYVTVTATLLALRDSFQRRRRSCSSSSTSLDQDLIRSRWYSRKTTLLSQVSLREHDECDDLLSQIQVWSQHLDSQSFPSSLLGCR